MEESEGRSLSCERECEEGRRVVDINDEYVNFILNVLSGTLAKACGNSFLCYLCPIKVPEENLKADSALTEECCGDVN